MNNRPQWDPIKRNSVAKANLPTPSAARIATDARILSALDLMHRHKALAITSIATFLNLSVSHFRHLFKKETGIPPTQYQKLERLQRAKELLETSFLSVKQITVLVGGKDVSHFTRDYKALYGKTPSQARFNIATLKLPNGK